jgi:hypothetical protein
MHLSIQYQTERVDREQFFGLIMAIKVSMNARKTTNTLSLIILCDLISIIIPDVQY